MEIQFPLRCGGAAWGTGLPRAQGEPWHLRARAEILLTCSPSPWRCQWISRRGTPWGFHVVYGFPPWTLPWRFVRRSLSAWGFQWKFDSRGGAHAPSSPRESPADLKRNPKGIQVEILIPILISIRIPVDITVVCACVGGCGGGERWWWWWCVCVCSL